ncbi:MAG: hypothetical protein LBF65_01230 [Holosporales bacterium]|nr:hypothetical protein [Holosporales bacterium]
MRYPEKLQIILSKISVALICVTASFVSYCISQVLGLFLIPLTAVPIFIHALFIGNTAPGLVIVLTGIADDIFLNVPLGTFPLVYTIISYPTIIYEKHIRSKRLVCAILICAILAINKFPL